MNRQDAEMLVAVGGMLSGLIVAAVVAVALVIGQPWLIAAAVALLVAGVVWAGRLEKKLAGGDQ